MKIAITGDKGFVGSETRRQLEELGHTVIGFDVMDNKDIRDPRQFEQFIEVHRPDRVLHLAAIARFSDADKDPALAFETNVNGTLNVASVCKTFHIPLVYSSTGSVYMPLTLKKGEVITEETPAKGNSVYGCTKYMGELYVKKTTPHIILRYAHLYGREKRMHGLIGGFLERINRGLAPTLYGGKQSNDFTYIKDVAAANIAALTAPWDKWNQVYNIGTGEELSAEDAGKLVCKVAGYKGKIDKKEQRTVDPDRFAFDCSKAERMLGFKAAYTFEEGLKDMFSDLKVSHTGAINDSTV